MDIVCAKDYPSSLLTPFCLTLKHADHERSITINTISPLTPAIWQAMAFFLDTRCSI